MQKTTFAAGCPECTFELVVDSQVMVNEIIECSDCRSELELVSINPPELVLAPEVEEDWGE
jgi:alpha-aminoadipate carrier protein LysW